MFLSRRQTPGGPRWALGGSFLPMGVDLTLLLKLPSTTMREMFETLDLSEDAVGSNLAPIDPDQEVWGSGVTYLRSRDARKAESESSADVYEKVYDADRPEIFFKQIGWRVVGSNAAVRIRRDTSWNVPEPELTLVINSGGEIVGYTVGNDMSSRDIEGANPLYLPQAKTYTGSCALGPGIELLDAESMRDLAIRLHIERDGREVFSGETATSQMKRGFQELADYLYRELDFPAGALLMTGTGIVPPDDFTLQSGDRIRISIGDHTLENLVA